MQKQLIALIAVFLFAASVSAQQFQFYGWLQPATAQRIIYPTPLRDLLFGRQRLVPTGPPQPYYLVPGRVVAPQIVWPDVPQPAPKQKAAR